MTYDLWCLASVTLHNVFSTHLCYIMYQSVLHSFLWPKNTLLYGDNAFCLSLHQLMKI